MLSHMHPQLAEFFAYRVEQQKLLEQLEGPGAVMPMPDLKGLRAWYKMFSQRVGGPVPEVAEVKDLVADTEERPLRLRYYRPFIPAAAATPAGPATPDTSATTANPATPATPATPVTSAATSNPATPAPPASQNTSPLPCIIYFHGGGWSMGDLDTHDRVCRRLALAAEAVVLSVEYALSPELPWPQAPHDAIAATRWVQAHAPALNIDAARMAVAGDSAGGNLAAIVALALRTQPAPGSPLLAQILIYPATDLRSGFDPRYPSLADNAERPPLSSSQMREHMRHYLEENARHAEHEQASPLLASSHRGAPPALILTAGLDPLRDDGFAYAQTLSRAGVDVQLNHFAGHTHGFIEMAGVLDTVPAAFSLIGQWFRQRQAPSSHTA